MVLGWIGNKKAVLPLTWALTDNNQEVKKMAAWALGKIGNDKAATALEHTVDDYNKKDEKINNKIAILNEQLQVLEAQITVLENEIILQEFPVLEDQISAIEEEIMLQESSIAETQSETADDREYYYNNALFKKIKEKWDFRPVVLAATMIEAAEAEKDKVETSIKELKKVHHKNNDIKEYAREAIQRLHYN
jgi:predicted  nucleic acid-binding Zn-ribbon protein